MAKDRKKIIKALDEQFSLLIRMEGMDPVQHTQKCCTCPKVAHWREFDCGHLYSRTTLLTRWMKENASPQCRDCNSRDNGTRKRHRIYIDNKYGEGTADQVKADSYKAVKYLTWELEYELQLITNEVADLKVKYNC